MEEFESIKKPKLTINHESNVDTISIDGKDIVVTKKESAQLFLERAQYLNVLKVDPIMLEKVPVLFLDERFNYSRGGYSLEYHVILMPTNAKHNEKEQVRIIEHEIVHALTTRFIREHVITDFEKLYEAVKNELTEDDVTLNGLTTFNFAKNIYEFVADAVTHPNIIQALKDKGMYEMTIKYIQGFVDQAKVEFLEQKEALEN